MLNNPMKSFENKNSLEKYKRENEEPYIHKRKIAMSQCAWELIDEINKKSLELNVFYECQTDFIFVYGQEKSLDMLAQFIEGLFLAKKFDTEINNHYNQDQNNEVLTQKELKIPKEIKGRIEEIENKANELKIIYENLDDKLLITGLQCNIMEFTVWIYDLIVNCLQDLQEETRKNPKVIDIENGNLNYEDEINISTFHRAKKNDIIQKMNELNLKHHFGYDTILTSGALSSIKELKSYLHDVEAVTKKSLYPKYWDFHEEKAFSEIMVKPSTEEFLEVSSLFTNSLSNVTVTKITRIQNRYLMDHYITMLQKRKELRPNTEMNRQLLFHGTRTVNPKNIYQKSDVGFDLQYSKVAGSYGRGLYFAIHASYTHNGYGYNSSKDRYQMFLADVFVGKSYSSGPNNTLVKPPEGYDSIHSSQSFYIIYNNYHSYPLYLIEYKNNKNFSYKPLSVAKAYATNNTSIVNYRQNCSQIGNAMADIKQQEILDKLLKNKKKKKSLLQKLFGRRKKD